VFLTLQKLNSKRHNQFTRRVQMWIKLFSAKMLFSDKLLSGFCSSQTITYLEFVNTNENDIFSFSRASAARRRNRFNVGAGNAQGFSIRLQD
jgi:hypothetical protein